MRFQEYYEFDINELEIYEFPTHLCLITEASFMGNSDAEVSGTEAKDLATIAKQTQPQALKPATTPVTPATTVIKPLAQPTPQEIQRAKQIPLKPRVEELRATTLLKNTDKGRTYRGIYNIKRKKTFYKETKENLDLLSFNFLAEPSIQQKHHYGYIIWNDDAKTKPVYEVYCDCSDFQFRLYYPFVKKGYAKWKIDKKYADNTTLTKVSPDGKVIQIPFEHNKEPSRITNPTNKLYCCKHLYQAIRSYVVGLTPTEKLEG